MRRIERATYDQAERLFEIMVQATEISCAKAYPPEVIEIWNNGRSAEGVARVIVEGNVYSLVDAGIVRGFVHIGDFEVIGLFVHPSDHGKGYGTQLFTFAVDKIKLRPVIVKATLNATSFYATLGCRRIATESVRRYDQDIQLEIMEWG